MKFPGTLKRKSRRVVEDAVLVHIDIVGSTTMVRESMENAHRKIHFQYARIEKICQSYHGHSLEVRGDAVLFLFQDAAKALRAALEIQRTNFLANQSRLGFREPRIRIGISRGAVVMDDRMNTGVAIIRAQRLEQLAEPGGVMIDGSVRDALTCGLVQHLQTRGEKTLKGFPGTTPVFHAAPMMRGFPVAA